jgi:hypothetical protein
VPGRSYQYDKIRLRLQTSTEVLLSKHPHYSFKGIAFF